MSNRGYVDYQNVEVKNKQAFYEWIQSDEIPDFVQTIQQRYNTTDASVADNYLGEKKTLRKAVLDVVAKEKNMEGMGEAIVDSLFEDTKVIGYWYQGFSVLLRELAMFLEGAVRVIGEADDGFATIIWEDNQLNIEIGEITWQEHIEIGEITWQEHTTVESEHTVESIADIPPLPDEVKLVREL